MGLLEWKLKYAIGVAGVDLEHRELIAMINALYERLDQRRDSDGVEECLGEIHATIAAHFALEETYMRAGNYDEYKIHKEDHEELLDQIRDFMDRHTEDPVTGREVLRRRLDQWFTVHFSSHDARLHRKMHI